MKKGPRDLAEEIITYLLDRDINLWFGHDEEDEEREEMIDDIASILSPDEEDEDDSEEA